MSTVEGKEVLVISNSAEMASLVRLTLVRERNDEVRIAIGGHRGLSAADEDCPDLIFLEIMMPGLDGWEVLKQLREDASLCRTPVLLTSAWASQEAYPRVQRAGASGFIGWPASPQEIVAARDTVLQGLDYYPACEPQGCLAFLRALVRSMRGRHLSE